jgi:hypothetical protein
MSYLDESDQDCPEGIMDDPEQFNIWINGKREKTKAKVMSNKNGIRK